MISIPHEFPLIQELNNWKNMSKIPLNEYLLQFAHFKDWNIKKDVLENVSKNARGQSIPQLAQKIYDQFLDPHIQNKKVWGEKNIGNIGYVNEIRRDFPSAKFIFLIRDPRAIVASVLKRNWLFSKYQNKPRRYMKSIFGITSLLLDGEKFINETKTETDLLLKYEDLVLHPDETIQEICNFLSIEFESSMLNGHAALDEKLRVSKKRITNTHENINKSISADFIFSFRKTLSNQQISFVENRLKKSMEVYNYEFLIKERSKSNSSYLFFEKIKNNIMSTVMYSLVKIKKLIRA